MIAVRSKRRREQVKTTTEPPTLAHFCLFVKNHIKDPRTRRPMELLDWQYPWLARFFAWDHDDDRWKHSFTLLGAPKKVGKSALMAILGLFWLDWHGFPQCVVCITAASEEQAKKPMYIARRMVELSPYLSKRMKPLDDRIVRRPAHGGDGFIYLAPCSEHAIEGENVKLMLGDQLESILTPRQEDAFDASMRCTNGHHDGRVVWCTHSGAHRAGRLWDIFRQGRDACPASWHFRWFSPDPERKLGLTAGEKYRDPVNWRAANPSLPITASEAQIAEICDRVGEAEFRQRFLCEWPPENPDWVTRKTLLATIDSEMRRAEDPLDTFDPALPVYAGIDLSHSQDASSVTALQPIPDGDDWTRARMYTKIWQHPDPGITVWVVPYDEVIGHIQDIYRRFKAPAMVNRPRLTRRQKNTYPDGALMGCDPKFATNLTVPLSKTSIRLVIFPQTDAKMVPAADDLRTYFNRKRIIWDGDAKFIKHMNSVVLKPKAMGPRISRDLLQHPRTFIDGAISAAIAVRMWIEHNHGKQEIKRRTGPSRLHVRRLQIKPRQS